MHRKNMNCSVVSHALLDRVIVQVPKYSSKILVCSWLRILSFSSPTSDLFSPGLDLPTYSIEFDEIEFDEIEFVVQKSTYC